MDKQYISNKDESVPLFENKFLDTFTHVHVSIPPILYLPLISFFTYRALAETNLSVFAVFVLFLAGTFFWTLTEYFVHRYVFHFKPKSKIGKYLSHLMHGVHHDYPNDSLRLVMPPVVSIPLAFFFYGLFKLLLGQTIILAFYPGFILGYLCYDMIHYATHHAPMKSRLGQWTKHHHIKHHYQDDKLGFGVSSPFWDMIFKTSYSRT